VHDLEAVAVRKLGRRMLGARHDFTISFDGDGPFGETETIQETADGQAGVHDAGLSVDDELHVAARAEGTIVATRGLAEPKVL
jgi:hypothetical protein